MYVNYWPDLRNLGMACLARVLQYCIGCQGDLGGDAITTCPKKEKATGPIRTFNHCYLKSIIIFLV